MQIGTKATLAGAILFGSLGAHAEEGVYRIGGGVSAPVVIFRVDPRYTPEAEKAQIQGTVVLSAVITTAGKPESIAITRPLGGGLDENAIAAFRQWRFKPGNKDGQPVNVRMTVEIPFRLPADRDGISRAAGSPKPR